VLEGDAAQHEWASRDEAVRVVARAHAIAHPSGS
jgi:hypothetical protein